MKHEITEQEKFWSGSFGDEYSKRNRDDSLLASNTVLFSKILSRTKGVSSLIEFGANVGLNLLAIRNVLPSVNLAAIEINEYASKQLQKNLPDAIVYKKSLLNFKSNKKWDFSLIKGVLIHQNPAKIRDAYSVLYNSSSHYVCLVEYYNPSPVEVAYRGHAKKLFKRDFAGEMMEIYPDLKLVDYGFVYHGDRVSPLDDVTWFLMEKKGF